MIGKNKNTFKLQMDANWYRKGEILISPQGASIKVIKRYDIRWYHKVLLWMGFKVKIFKGLLVEVI